MKEIAYRDWGMIEYGEAWERQEAYLKRALDIKAKRFTGDGFTENDIIKNYLFICRHPHVYTLGKSGAMENLLVNDERLKLLDVSFYKTNRGGDITYHGPGQMVAYPVLDLEQFYTDLGKYMRSLEEVIIRTIGEYGITGGRLEGSTGVWLDADDTNRARKICAMGVRCSRWITMHGLALNINTDLNYFNHIVPCGIVDKGVTSLQKELNYAVDEKDVQDHFLHHFADVFNVKIDTGIAVPSHQA